MEKYKDLLNQLRNGEIEKVEISKADYLAFREVLVQDPQFKHFRGEAKQGGNIVFKFLATPRT
ncbi:hypothetical protein [Lysinibacillus odysseyi]|uniref:Abortive phage infection protein n=1 Tax=Lysinibacillus odysseyi 34hs-1 = NBRC 100172 TaxID=1220589 RepID=A0A0A3JA55_9BACI|nr:hypothetical protein [Lysinibacillus odysseyi]KGR83907.1 hypothetical protein CD32_14525 [Lysinibacillus odysseyi 34hs-1 = NBRC 100172]